MKCCGPDCSLSAGLSAVAVTYGSLTHPHGLLQLSPDGSGASGTIHQMSLTAGSPPLFLACLPNGGLWGANLLYPVQDSHFLWHLQQGVIENL